jgi:Peptidase family M23
MANATKPLTRSFVAWALFVFATLAVHAPNARADSAENMTPLLLAVHDAPVPFMGSDGSIHLVYELWMTNFSSADIAVQKVEVLGDGALVQSLDTATVAQRLQPSGLRESASKLAKSTNALLFLHITLAPGTQIPRQLTHRVTLSASAAPPGHQILTEDGGETTIDRQSVVVIAPPLHGERYVSADSCCDAVRHTRAAMPVNGRVWVTQRYAVDWEQLDASGRIYTGASAKLESYTIFGKAALAVADATVASVTDGLPEQTPGKYPTNISLAEADGNSVILSLGDHRFALYAHLQPGSIKVHRGDKVKLGQVLGLVGNSGNSVAPHLHFQVAGGPSALASNGLPYEIDDFQITAKSPGTKAFDEAEAKGTSLVVTPISPAQSVKNALPLDQLIISFIPR